MTSSAPTTSTTAHRTRRSRRSTSRPHGSRNWLRFASNHLGRQYNLRQSSAGSARRPSQVTSHGNPHRLKFDNYEPLVELPDNWTHYGYSYWHPMIPIFFMLPICVLAGAPAAVTVPRLRYSRSDHGRIGARVPATCTCAGPETILFLPSSGWSGPRPPDVRLVTTRDVADPCETLLARPLEANRSSHSVR